MKRTARRGAKGSKRAITPAKTKARAKAAAKTKAKPKAKVAAKAKPKAKLAPKAKPKAKPRPRAKPAPSTLAFSAAIERDATTGWELIVLRLDDTKTGGSEEVRIAPAAGSNVYSWSVDGEELLHQPDSLAALADQRAGTPLMYPTVNRVRDGRMSFEGRAFSFEPNSGRNFIHGLARRRPFALGPVSSDGRSAASGTTILEWDERQPDWERFAIKHRLTLTFTLRQGGLTIAYQVDNQDAAKLPYGFGLHPYFRVPGAREEVSLSAPLAQRMEAEELLPTGKLISVAGTPHDLRRPSSLAGLALDDVYIGMTPAKTARFSRPFATGRLDVTLGGSPEFTHLVVYTPPDRPFFCIENQTSSTDAHNLWAQGKKKESHLLVVAPGKRGAGQVEWTFTRTSTREQG